MPLDLDFSDLLGQARKLGLLNKQGKLTPKGRSAVKPAPEPKPVAQEWFPKATISLINEVSCRCGRIHRYPGAATTMTKFTNKAGTATWLAANHTLRTDASLPHEHHVHQLPVVEECEHCRPSTIVIIEKHFPTPSAPTLETHEPPLLNRREMPIIEDDEDVEKLSIQMEL